MHKSTLWISLTGAAAALTMMVMPWSFQDAGIGVRIARQVADTAGLETAFNGPVSFSVLPSPQIIFQSVSIRDVSGALSITAPRMVSKLRFLPLIAGRIEVAATIIDQPVMALDIDRLKRLESAIAARSDDTAPLLGAIVINQGRASIRSSATSPDSVELHSIAFMIDWRNRDSLAALSGHAIWRGEKIDIGAMVSSPADILAGQTSRLNLDLKSSLANLTLDGELSAGPRWQFAGKISGATKSAIKFQETTQITWPLPGKIDRVAINGNARINTKSIALSNLRLDLDRNSLLGTLTLQNDEGKSSITGTLAAESLAFDPRNSYLPPPASPGGEWNTAPVNLASLARLNMDIRVSTARLRFGRIELADVALSSLIKDGRVEMSLSSANSYSGLMKTRISLNANTPSPQIRALVQLENIDSGRLLKDVAHIQSFSGRFSGDAEFRSHGRSIHELIQNSSGTVKSNATAGFIDGLNIERTLRQPSDPARQVSLNTVIKDSRLQFNRAQMSAAMTGGDFTLTKASTESDHVDNELSGTVSMLARTLRLKVDATYKTAEAEPGTALALHTAPLTVRFGLMGPWTNPALSIIRDTARDATATIPVFRLGESIISTVPAAGE